MSAAERVTGADLPADTTGAADATASAAIGAAITDTADGRTGAPATAPQTLSSLASLLGGSFAGGQACSTGGACD